MNIEKMCATTDTSVSWNEIDFKKAEKCVKKLQKRIAVAYKNQRYDVVMYLQHQLVHSFYAKALAVRCVSTNRGKYTPGIDEVIWNNAELKFEGLISLNRRGYTSQPLKRIYIPKSNGKMRPLSIPTMHDRAMQTLYKFALEPIAEVTADKHSYGFRTNRCVKDAIIHICNVFENYHSVKWVVKVDIKSCFDNINHEWLLENIFMDKDILRKFIKSPYVENSTLYPTARGVPQGGAISSIICNMTLDGLESRLSKSADDVYMIRYADDIMVLGSDRETLVQCVVPTIEKFLSERGLNLAEEKTTISHISQGITFLGWKLYKEDKRIISIPTRKSINSLLAKIEEVLMCEERNTYEQQCKALKPIIRGWLNFYIGVAEEHSLYGVEYEIISLINSLGYKYIADYINWLFSKYL